MRAAGGSPSAGGSPAPPPGLAWTASPRLMRAGGAEALGGIYDEFEGGDAGAEGSAVLRERAAKLQRRCDVQGRRLLELEERAAALERENGELRRDRETLVRNISVLYKTAVEEIGRLRKRLTDEMVGAARGGGSSRGR